MAPIADAPPAEAHKARVVVITREGCHLCDDALSIVRSVCDDVHADWLAVDVDTDETLSAVYTDHVPVTFVDGVEFSAWVLDKVRLRSALA
ncbi:MAG: glutaredoxin family protein [Propionibacteriaceae bacterium]